MPIERKLPPAEETYEDYLARGGRAAGQTPEPSATPADVKFTLTIPGPLAVKVDQLRTQRLAKMPRHRWVIEAIEQRVAREDQGRPHA
jgi:hypothetical protein